MSSGALAGLCPRCLLAGVLEDDDHAERTSESAVADLSSGTTLGPFVIVELLGKGGMATVYHAYETELDRDVALKVLPPEFLHDHSFARRFEREAKLVAKLEHPNIVPIYASGIDAGIPWMSMRLLAGGSLDTILKEERLSLARVVELLRGVAEGLDHAHAHGVIHRDVKPSNILLDDANRVCVGDFGLARVAERSLVHTQTGMAGTPHYMAPEQALGGEVDHRCDIYSLGIVVYEMLTGRVPFAADSPLAVLMKYVSEQIPIPRGQGPAEPLWRVVEQCLATEPDGRWPSATAFAAAMEGAVTISALESDVVLVVSEQQSTTEPSRSSPAEIAEVPRVRPVRRRAVLARVDGGCRDIAGDAGWGDVVHRAPVRGGRATGHTSLPGRTFIEHPTLADTGDSRARGRRALDTDRGCNGCPRTGYGRDDSADCDGAGRYRSRSTSAGAAGDRAVFRHRSAVRRVRTRNR